MCPGEGGGGETQGLPTLPRPLSANGKFWVRLINSITEAWLDSINVGQSGIAQEKAYLQAADPVSKRKQEKKRPQWL